MLRKNERGEIRISFIKIGGGVEHTDVDLRGEDTASQVNGLIVQLRTQGLIQDQLIIN